VLLLSGIYSEKNIRLFSYAELRSATDNFNRTNKVGRGGFGTVYKVTKHFLMVFSLRVEGRNQRRAIFPQSMHDLLGLAFLEVYLVTFQGTIRNGREVAVKVLSAESRQGIREFLTEIDVISNVKHPNLVELIGCCVEGNNRILVYEYLKNSSLDRALLGMNLMPLY
jgi:serine/threonine protein kinase